MKQLSASLLAADFLNLEQSVCNAKLWGADTLHIDIMDGWHVHSFGFNGIAVEAIARLDILPLNIHLMTREPMRFLEDFAFPGIADMVFQAEAEREPLRVLERIRAHGLRAGIAIAPDTLIEPLLPAMVRCDVITVMSIAPGCAGSVFLTGALEKIALIDRFRKEANLSFEISVDGGITPELASACFQCGADKVIMGTAFFKAKAPQEVAKAVKTL